MARREVVMCDTAECHTEAGATCAACEQDVCVGKHNSHGMRLEFSAGLGNSVLDTGLVMCQTCLKSVKLDHVQRYRMFATLGPFIEFLRSHMARSGLAGKS